MSTHLRRAVLSPHDRFIGARSPLAILRSFCPFAPLRIYFILVIALLGGSTLSIAMLRQLITHEAAFQWGLLGGLVGGFAVTLIATVEWCHRLADCKFEIRNDILEIRAPTRVRIRSAKWPLCDIHEFILDSRPTILEDLAEAQLVLVFPALIAGAAEMLGGSQRPERILRIRSNNGTLTEFCLLNRVFDQVAVNTIANELACRGVQIRRVSFVPE